MPKKITLIVILLFYPAILFASGDDRFVTDRSHVCMVNDTYAGATQIKVEVDGRTYYGCCPGCVEQLKNNKSVRYSKDPVSSNSVDKADAVILKSASGKVLYFESRETAEEYLKRTNQISSLLKENPEIIIDVLRQNNIAVYDIAAAGQEGKQRNIEMERRKAQLKDPLKPAIESGRIIRGKSDAPITIVEYSDFECPYCARSAKTVDDLFEKYKGRIRFVYKHNPLPFHKAAMPAALYFEAITKQDTQKALQFHNMLFANQAGLKKGEDAVKEMAASLGINMERLAEDVMSKDIAEHIQRDIDEAKKFGFSGTPAFVINGISLTGAYPTDEFVEVIKMTESK